MKFRCGEHDVELVYDFPLCGWVCPEDDPVLLMTDEIVSRLQAPVP